MLMFIISINISIRISSVLANSPLLSLSLSSCLCSPSLLRSLPLSLTHSLLLALLTLAFRDIKLGVVDMKGFPRAQSSAFIYSLIIINNRIINIAMAIARELEKLPCNSHYSRWLKP